MSGNLTIMAEVGIELWVDDHRQEHEPGVVRGHLRHAQVAIDPHPGDYLIVGDGEVPPRLAEVLERDADGRLQLRIVPGRLESHPEFGSRRVSTVA